MAMVACDDIPTPILSKTDFRNILDYSSRVRSIPWLIDQMRIKATNRASVGSGGGAAKLPRGRQKIPCETRLMNFLTSKKLYGDVACLDDCIMCTKDTKIQYKGTKWRVRRLVYALCTPASSTGMPTGILMHENSSAKSKHLEHEHDEDNVDDPGCDGDSDDEHEDADDVGTNVITGDDDERDPENSMRRLMRGCNFEKTECINPLHQRHVPLKVKARNKHGTTAVTESILKRHYPAAVEQRTALTTPIYKRPVMHDLFALIPHHISILKTPRKCILKKKFYARQCMGKSLITLAPAINVH
jgi:hypothetical protein